MTRVLIFGAKATANDPHAVHGDGAPPTTVGNRTEPTTCRGMRVLAMRAALALTVIAVAPSAIAASFDGDWSLVAQSPDHCGTTRWPLAIRGGQVYYPGGSALGYPVRMAGRVSRSGVIRVIVAAGPRTASGAGRLGRFQGSGRWAGQGPSGTCAGIWTATRVSPYRASAIGR